MKENNLENNQEPASLTNSFWNLSKRNKELLDSGTPTLIPFTLPALKKIVPGIIPGEVIILTSGTGSGKSRIARKMALKDIVTFCQSKGIKVRVFLNSLEETPEKVIATLVNKELNERFGVASSYYKIANYCEENSLTDEQMEKVKLATEIVEEKYGDILEVVKESNPFAFYKKIREYLFSVGKFYHIVKDVNGKVTSKTQVKLGDQWNHYEYNEPTIVVTIFDTIDKTQGYSSILPNSDVKVTLNQYDAINKYVHYYVGELLGPVCKVISFIISQQLSEKERIETNYKGQTLIEKLKPSLDTIRTNRSIQETATLIIGIFNPVKYGEYGYNGYKNLNKLIDGQYRSFLVLKTREGVIEYPKDEIPVFTQFQFDEYHQFPAPNETEKLRKYYKT